MLATLSIACLCAWTLLSCNRSKHSLEAGAIERHFEEMYGEVLMVKKEDETHASRVLGRATTALFATLSMLSGSWLVWRAKFAVAGSVATRTTAEQLK